jgi:hypothetical protein
VPEVQARPQRACRAEEEDVRISGASLVTVVGLIGVVGFAFPVNAFAAEQDSSAVITVLVDNYTEASPVILRGAEREVGRILGKAGLQAIWLECPMQQSASVPLRPCLKEPEATDIRLRILPLPIRNRFQDGVFGFAVPPVLASVYYEYAVRRARSDDAEFELPIILGSVVAHEIGHLLFGSHSHSRTGIMQPQWDREQVRQMMMGTLLFSPCQSELMREAIRTRMGLPGTLAASVHPSEDAVATATSRLSGHNSGHSTNTEIPALPPQGGHDIQQQGENGAP